MKKFLLSLAVLSLGFAAQADELKITWSSEGYTNAQDVTTVDKSPVTIKCDKGSNNNAPKYYNSGTALRLYGGNTMTISVPSGYVLDGISFTTGSSNAFNSASTASTGTFNVSGAKWTPDASEPTSSVTFTQGGSSGHVRIETTTITYSLAGNPGLKPAGLSFSESTVVTAATKSVVFNAPVLSNPNNLPITWESTNPSVATVNADGVVTIVTNAFGTGGTTEIIAKSEETAEFNAGEARYTINSASVATSVAQMKKLAPNKGDIVYVNRPLYVVYVNGNYVYVQDHLEDGTLLYGAYNLEAGDIIPQGWYATNSTYNGLLEWNGEVPAPTSTSTSINFETVSEVSLDDVNNIVYLSNVEFSAATPDDNSNFTGTYNGKSYTFRNTFKIASAEAGTYKVLCAVGQYNNDLQLYPISYSAAGVVSDGKVKFTAEYPVEYEWVPESNLEDEHWMVTVKVPVGTQSIPVTITPPTGFSEVYTLLAAWGANPMNARLGDTVTIPVTDDEEDTTPYLVCFGNDNTPDYDTFVRVYFLAMEDPNVGVEGIAAETEATYFTLDGVKVVNPEKGLYIKVANGKAEKVIF